MTILPFLAIFTTIMVVINFGWYLIKGRNASGDRWFMILEFITVLCLPLLFLLLFDIFEKNDCCTDSAVFSPEHRIGIYILIVLYTIAYGVNTVRKQIFAPLVELLLNVMLMLGIIINLALCFQLNTSEAGPFFWVFGNLPILLLLFMKLHKNHKMLISHIAKNEIGDLGGLGTFALRILQLDQTIKYPILIILVAPLLALISIFLLLFGQKPDSLIRSFTDTYKHGFSQLDHECMNVSCGGHFLCSVGANGHKAIVKPLRYGERNGAKIICNRQLLVSNAFEELVQEKLPKTHKYIRRNYNRVGNVVHRYYYIFNKKWVSNSVYMLMKPLEWCFLVVLYCTDKNPENRIAKQYLSAANNTFIAARNSERISKTKNTVFTPSGPE